MKQTGPQSYWKNNFTYMLSIIGYVVDLGNFWRFPTMCYKYGGGAFLVPYVIVVILVGIPLMFLEMSLGQVLKKANLGIWDDICPWIKGIGYTVIIINLFVTSFSTTIIAWSLYYMFASLQSPLPWENYVPPAVANNTNRTIDYFSGEVQHSYLSTGINDLGNINTQLLPLLVLVYVVIFASNYKGAVSIGHAMYVTVLVPYFLLFLLLVRACLLPGATDGLIHLFSPDFGKLLEFEVWNAAAVQVSFSLGPSFGVLMAFASYSANEKLNLNIASIVVPIVNGLSSILCSLVVYAGLGYLSKKQNTTLDSFGDMDLHLVFTVYPEILSTLKAAPFFSLAFFTTVFLLGLNSIYAGIDGVYAALADDWPIVRHNCYDAKILIMFCFFLTSLPCITYGGEYVITFLDGFGISPAIMLVVFIETCAVAYVYGARNYASLVERVCKFRTAAILLLCWRVVVPVTVMALFVVSLVTFSSDVFNFGSEKVTARTIKLGWCLSFGSLLPIPLYAIWYAVKRHRDKYVKEILLDNFAHC